MGEIASKEQFVRPTTSKASKPILNCLSSPNQITDWRETGDFVDSGKPEPTAPVNHSGTWLAVENQEDTGSCVGWACASLIEWHAITAGILPPGSKLSARYLWIASKEMDEIIDRPTTFLELAGTTIKQCLSIARNYGVVSESRFPFGESVDPSLEVAKFYEEAARLRIDAYYNLNTPEGLVTPRAWRFWLERAPLVARLRPDAAFREYGNPKPLANYDSNTAQGGHAVVVAGWDANGFLIRNSWGTGWGQGGYRRATDDYVRKAFTEAYGISLSRQANSGSPQPA